MSEALNALSGYIQEKLGAKIGEAVLAYGELTLSADASDIVEV